MPTLDKYLDEQNEDEHGGKLWWGNTLTGLPIRGAPDPYLKREEVERLPLQADAHIQLFDLSKAEDRETYTSITEKAANGWYRILYQERRFNEDTKHFLAYVEWLQYYHGDKPERFLEGYYGEDRR